MLEILKYISFAIAFTIGIIGVLRRDTFKDGKLTKWGVLMIVMLVFSALVTVITQIQQDKIGAQNKDRLEKDSINQANQIHKLDSQLRSVNYGVQGISETQQITNYEDSTRALKIFSHFQSLFGSVDKSSNKITAEVEKVQLASDRLNDSISKTNLYIDRLNDLAKATLENSITANYPLEPMYFSMGLKFNLGPHHEMYNYLKVESKKYTDYFPDIRKTLDDFKVKTCLISLMKIDIARIEFYSQENKTNEPDIYYIAFEDTPTGDFGFDKDFIVDYPWSNTVLQVQTINKIKSQRDLLNSRVKIIFKVKDIGCNISDRILDDPSLVCLLYFKFKFGNAYKIEDVSFRGFEYGCRPKTVEVNKTNGTFKYSIKLLLDSSRFNNGNILK